MISLDWQGFYASPAAELPKNYICRYMEWLNVKIKIACAKVSMGMRESVFQKGKVWFKKSNANEAITIPWKEYNHSNSSDKTPFSNAVKMRKHVVVLQWAICRLLAVILYLYQMGMKYSLGCVRLTLHLLFSICDIKQNISKSMYFFSAWSLSNCNSN